MSSSRPMIVFVGVLSVGAPAGVLAADLESGRARAASVCAACHGADGVSVANHIPHLAGQRAIYIESQLDAFKDGSRKHDVMNPIAAQLSVADISNLAAYFATLRGAAAGAKSKPLLELSQARYAIPVDFPKGFMPYRSTPSEGGKRASVNYVNAAALVAAKAGQALPDGSAIVGVTMVVKLDSDGKPLTGADGYPVADKVLSYSTMASAPNWDDAIPDLLRNGNWTYALFTAVRQPREGVSYAECFACHKARSATSYVFTLDQVKAVKY